VFRVNAGTIKALCAMVFAGLGIIQFGAFMPDTHVGQVRILLLGWITRDLAKHRTTPNAIHRSLRHECFGCWQARFGLLRMRKMPPRRFSVRTRPSPALTCAITTTARD
jgi:hypothetical protein